MKLRRNEIIYVDDPLSYRGVESLFDVYNYFAGSLSQAMAGVEGSLRLFLSLTLRQEFLECS